MAVYVRPAAAIRLQMLWDRGNRLVSLLDDLSWEVLAELPAPEALIVIDEAAERYARGYVSMELSHLKSCL